MPSTPIINFLGGRDHVTAALVKLLKEGRESMEYSHEEFDMQACLGRFKASKTSTLLPAVPSAEYEANPQKLNGKTFELALSVSNLSPTDYLNGVLGRELTEEEVFEAEEKFGISLEEDSGLDERIVVSTTLVVRLSKELDMLPPQGELF